MSLLATADARFPSIARRVPAHRNQESDGTYTQRAAKAAQRHA
ncbi:MULTISPECIES: hypothetical protein [Streptomyces]|nr:hypothetical protein [Streptomyces venezuelae]